MNKYRVTGIVHTDKSVGATKKFLNDVIHTPHIRMFVKRVDPINMKLGLGTRHELAAIMVAMSVGTKDDAEEMGYGIADQAYGTLSDAELQKQRDHYKELSAMIPATVKDALYRGDDILINLIGDHLEEVL